MTDKLSENFLNQTSLGGFYTDWPRTLQIVAKWDFSHLQCSKMAAVKPQLFSSV